MRDASAPVPRGFATLLAAQFLSALADNTLLIVAIAALVATASPAWMTPILKFLFIASYVLLAFVVGAIADAMLKSRVMLITNGLKAAGCVLLMAGVHPLAAYALVGMGAAAYSPAKYGLLVELLPPQRLVEANAWLEALTIGAVIVGAVLGGALVSPEFAGLLGEPEARTPKALKAATCVVLLMYASAAAVNLFVPDSGRQYDKQPMRMNVLAIQFWRALCSLWRDPQGQLSLSVTTLLWGVGAVLQFVVLVWAQASLHLGLDRASMLQGVVAVGVAAGAVIAARTVRLCDVLRILPFGVVLGPLILLLLPSHTLASATVVLALLGLAAGFFVVPMNALLQHRGAVVMNAGQSIAVQNFCENLSVMAMLGTYAAMHQAGVSIDIIATGLALVTAVLIGWLARRSRAWLASA
jgi:MFS family permease